MPFEIDKNLLNHHPVYGAVTSLSELRLFMENHVFAVWDFMSLLKYTQSLVAPTTVPWVPQGQGQIRRFINEMVLGEESDESLVSGEYLSHYELYLKAMEEVGANTAPIKGFVETVKAEGIDIALTQPGIPKAARNFVRYTFGLIQRGRAPEIVAALALGREEIIPDMFQALLEQLGVKQTQAPIFHYYLQRHIELDGDHHGPLAIRLLMAICEGDATKIKQAESTAREAILARLRFWDGVMIQLEAKTFEMVS